MKYDLNRKDVFVWFCRNDEPLALIEAYLRGDAEEQGRSLYEQIEKALRAVEEYACTHLLLVCEKGGRYADFVKKEYERISPSRTARRASGWARSRNARYRSAKRVHSPISTREIRTTSCSTRWWATRPR